MFPQRLDSPLAYDIAKAMLDGFNRHYRLFRAESARAKHRFETADWHGQQRAQRERIEFYDLRVSEAVARLEKEFKAGEQPMDVWQQVKLHYIGLLVDHHQPELAETFFNSVTTKILHRTLLPQRLHLRAPGRQHRVHRERRAGGAPTYRAYYPTRDTLGDTIVRMRRQLPAAGPLRRPAARRRAACSQAIVRALAPGQAARQLPDPGAVVACSIATRAPTWSARSSTASSSCRSRCRSCTTARASFYDRRGAVRRRRPADAVQLRAGLLHGRHGSARRPTCSSCAR